MGRLLRRQESHPIRNQLAKRERPINPRTNLTPDHPLASRDPGEEAGRDGAAGEGQHGDDGDGQPDREKGRGRVAADDQAGDRRQEEQVHQVHSERAFRQGGDKTGRGLAANAGEHEEQAESGQQDIRGAELPRPFENGCLDELARDPLPPEGPAGKGGADQEAGPSDDEFALPGPVQMVMDVMGQHKIAEISGAIP